MSSRPLSLVTATFHGFARINANGRKAMLDLFAADLTAPGWIRRDGSAGASRLPVLTASR